MFSFLLCILGLLAVLSCFFMKIFFQCLDEPSTSSDCQSKFAFVTDSGTFTWWALSLYEKNNKKENKTTWRLRKNWIVCKKWQKTSECFCPFIYTVVKGRLVICSVVISSHLKCKTIALPKKEYTSAKICCNWSFFKLLIHILKICQYWFFSFCSF